MLGANQGLLLYGEVSVMITKIANNFNIGGQTICSAFHKKMYQSNQIMSADELNTSLRKRLRIRSVISVNYHYITVLCPFNLLIHFKRYNSI